MTEVLIRLLGVEESGPECFLSYIFNCFLPCSVMGGFGLNKGKKNKWMKTTRGNKGSKKLPWYLQPKYYSTKSCHGTVRWKTLQGKKKQWAKSPASQDRRASSDCWLLDSSHNVKVISRLPVTLAVLRERELNALLTRSLAAALKDTPCERDFKLFNK